MSGAEWCKKQFVKSLSKCSGEVEACACVRACMRMYGCENYVFTCVCMCKGVYMYVCMFACASVCECICMYVCVCTFVCVWLRLCACLHMCAYGCMCLCVCVLGRKPVSKDNIISLELNIMNLSNLLFLISYEKHNHHPLPYHPGVNYSVFKIKRNK